MYITEQLLLAGNVAATFAIASVIQQEYIIAEGGVRRRDVALTRCIAAIAM